MSTLGGNFVIDPVQVLLIRSDPIRSGLIRSDVCSRACTASENQAKLNR